MTGIQAMRWGGEAAAGASRAIGLAAASSPSASPVVQMPEASTAMAVSSAPSVLRAEFAGPMSSSPVLEMFLGALAAAAVAKMSTASPEPEDWPALCYLAMAYGRLGCRHEELLAAVADAGAQSAWACPWMRP